MIYPSVGQYTDAIKLAEQSPEDYFATMTTLRAVLDGNGNPVMSSGNFAVVFKMQDQTDGKIYALKCFTRDQDGRNESYRLIADELQYVESEYLTKIQYLEKELFVDTGTDDTEFPVLLMDWVEGETLDKYIRKNIDDKYSLSMLAFRFSRLAMWLMPQPFAHGDLKPDNIIARKDGSLTLVDYDGMYVPAMKGQKSRELGSPDFRHPLRTEEDFDEHIDDFSLSTILLSLKAISLQPSLLDEYGAADRLLFSESDYREISERKVWDAVKRLLSDSELQKLYGVFLVVLSIKTLDKISFKVLSMSRPNQTITATKKIPTLNDIFVDSELEKIPFIVNGVSFNMILVREGSFRRNNGSLVTLSKYYIGETQVTNALWESVMGCLPSRQKDPNVNHDAVHMILEPSEESYGDNYPVKDVSWFDCQEFIKKLNRKTGFTFTLPTEAQWEFAARGGNKSKGFKYSGSDNADEVAQFDDLQPVAQLKPNELGIYDMSGNVSEWCQDWMGDYPTSDVKDPVNTVSAKCDYRVLRGGSWIVQNTPYNVSIETRSGFNPYLHSAEDGMRLALPITEENIAGWQRLRILKELVK